jgi:23S rRNA pseudouridine2605 synthase
VDIAAQRHVGLARRLSKLGFSSRSQAFILVRSGRVAVNGSVRRDPAWHVLDDDVIEVDGRAIKPAAKVYLMMNKPRGLLTTASDDKGRATVYSVLPRNLPWVGPVGRLDQASEGLLLFTNDSEWAARITAPQSQVYRVQISCVAGQDMAEKLESGIAVGGEFLRASRVSILRSGKKNSWIEVGLHEGRNRQVRRMLNALCIDVLRLLRTRIGPIVLGDLAKGRTRPLTAGEKSAIDRQISARL